MVKKLLASKETTLPGLLDWIKGLFSKGETRRKASSKAPTTASRKKAKKPKPAREKGPEAVDLETAPAESGEKKAPSKKKAASAKKKPASGEKKPASAKKKAASGEKKASAGKKKPSAAKKTKSSQKAAAPAGDKKTAGKAPAKSAKKKPARKKAPPPEMDVKVAKGKKKKKKAESPPPAEEASSGEEELAFGVQLTKKQAERRKAFRVPISSMQAVVHDEQDVTLQARDLSVMGLGVAAEGAESLKLGKTVSLDLVDQGATVAEQIQAKVMRKEQDMVGLMFVDMRRPDEDVLYDIVLREQKRMAERRRQKG
jgi:hypothetical protein